MSLSIASNEDLVIIDSADYVQVTFDNVAEFYSNNKPLECFFTLNELAKVESFDWIGIYKCGFAKCSDYVSSSTPNLNDIKDNKGKVVFSIEALPNEDHEFYQFVYVSQSKQIKGASDPFRFKDDVHDESIEISTSSSDQKGIPTAQIEHFETESELKARCEMLIKRIRSLEFDDEKKYEELRGLNFALRQAFAKLQSQLIISEQIRETQKSLIKNLGAENEELKKKYKLLENRQLHQQQQLLQFGVGGESKNRTNNSEEENTHFNKRRNAFCHGLSKNIINDKGMKPDDYDSYEIDFDELLKPTGWSSISEKRRQALDLQENKHKTAAKTYSNETAYDAAAAKNARGINSKWEIYGSAYSQWANHLKDLKLNQAATVSQISDESDNEQKDVCKRCDCVFPRGADCADIEKHYFQHHYAQGQECPVCEKQFDKGYSQSDFSKHVNDHFYASSWEL